MNKRFIMTCPPKSASNLLGHWITKNCLITFINSPYTRNHDLFKSHFNPFHRNGCQTGTFTNLVKWLLEDEVIFDRFHKLRSAHWNRMTRLLMSAPDPFFGIKWHPYWDGWLEGNQTSIVPDEMIDLAQQEGWQFITIRRRKPFEQFLSCYLSVHTGYFDYWRCRDLPALYESGAVDVDAQADHMAHIADLTKKSIRACKAIEKLDGTIALFYDDVVQGRCSKAFRNYFGVDLRGIVDLSEKQIRRPYEEMFTDIDQAKRIFERV